MGKLFQQLRSQPQGQSRLLRCWVHRLCQMVLLSQSQLLLLLQPCPTARSCQSQMLRAQLRPLYQMVPLCQSPMQMLLQLLCLMAQSSQLLQSQRHRLEHPRLKHLVQPMPSVHRRRKAWSQPCKPSQLMRRDHSPSSLLDLIAQPPSRFLPKSSCNLRFLRILALHLQAMHPLVSLPACLLCYTHLLVL